MTGTCPADAVLIEPPLIGYLPGQLLAGRPAIVLSVPGQVAIRDCDGPLSPGAGEVTSADEPSGAGGDLAGHWAP
ncbi:MAG TPA: hypothetical protein VMR14_22175 [Streptosporangiaceae bacterium]|jgi:hypothetical protein|nr:hypothetical protein [Streptosporangiaceae bacterium]